MTDAQLGIGVAIALGGIWWFTRDETSLTPASQLDAAALARARAIAARARIMPTAQDPGAAPRLIDTGPGQAPHAPIGVAPAPASIVYANGRPLASNCSAYQNTPPGCFLAVGRQGWDARTQSIVTFNGNNWVHVLGANTVTNPNNPDATGDNAYITPFAQ